MGFFTPLDQFDAINAIGHNLFEVVNNFHLYTSEQEFDMYLLYANAMSSESAAAFIFEIEFFLLVGLTGIFYFTPMVSIFTVGFTPLFFLCTIHFFTSFFVLI
jgi:hypothetical protein